VTGTGGNASTWGLQGPGNLDSFGQFGVIVGPSNSGAANRLTSVNITLHFLPGHYGEAVASNVEATNASGYYFATHYFPTTVPTGYIATNTLPATTTTPAPPALALLASGCVTVGAYAIRRRKVAAVTGP
jgi:hypothetical protein